MKIAKRGRPERLDSIIAIAEAAAAAAATALTVQEIDTSPSVAATELDVPNGSLSVVGTVATLAYAQKINGGRETIKSHGAMGATETLDLADGNYHYGTLDADCTLTFSGATSGEECSFTFEVSEDGTGGWTLTWPGSVIWPGGTEPTHDETASTTAIYVFATRDGGSTWYGFLTGSGGGGTPATTVTDETTWDITPDVGTDTEYARQDHTHGSPADPVTAAALVALGVVGPLLISDDHSTPIVFGDLLLTEDGDDFLYADLGG